MISIIICSVDPIQLAAIRLNIEATIGVPFEVIAIDNRIAPRGICAVYNEGAQRAKFDILCFMHEDVAFQTEEWGRVVLDSFDSNPQLGILGVAGGGYKSLTPSGWYCLDFQFAEKSFQNIIQGYKYDNRENFHALHNPHNQSASAVVCVDGVWMCTRKVLVQTKPFEEQLLKGFHGYDIDFCLSHFKEWEIMVTYEVLLIHYSEGNFKREWLGEVLKLHQKWSSYLPLTTAIVSESDIYFTEKRALKRLVEQMIYWDFSKMEIHQMLLNFKKSKKCSSKLFFKAYLHFIQLLFGYKKLTLAE